MIVVKKSERLHDGNLLHAHLLNLGITPERVEPAAEETRLYFETAEEETQAREALPLYQHREREVPPDRNVLLEDVRAKLREARDKKASAIPDWRNSVDEALAAMERLFGAVVGQ